MRRAPTGRGLARWTGLRAGIAALLAVGGVLVSQRTEAGSFIEDVTLELGGATRTFDVYQPDGLAPNAALLRILAEAW